MGSKKNTNIKIDTRRVFCEVFNQQNTNDPQFSFSNFLNATEENASQQYKPTKNALANARGAWFAWLFQILCDRELLADHLDFTIVKLPNVSGFPFTNLYHEDLRDLLTDFQEKLKRLSNVNLVTSNPDFAVISRNLSGPPEVLDSPLTVETLKKIDERYRIFKAQLKINDLIGFIGLKTSLRPDRRLQLLHEGSLVKAIHTHLKTRNWDIDAKPIKYFGIALECSKADVTGLQSVATHSIVTASSLPERAVDAIQAVDNLDNLKLFLDNCLR